MTRFVAAADAAVRDRNDDGKNSPSFLDVRFDDYDFVCRCSNEFDLE